MYSTAEAAALQLSAATQYAGASQSHVMLHASAHEQLVAHNCTTAVVRPDCKFGYGKITDVGGSLYPLKESRSIKTAIFIER
jgi:hypothetical protein